MKKDVSVHETEISEAVIPVQERREETMTKSRKQRELEDFQTSLKYHKIYHTKKAKSDDEGEIILPGKELEHQRRK